MLRWRLDVWLCGRGPGMCCVEVEEHVDDWLDALAKEVVSWTTGEGIGETHTGRGGRRCCKE